MTPRLPRRIAVALARHIAAMMLMGVVFASPTEAGIGDLMKKAKDTATKATGQKATAPAAAPAEGAKVVYDDVTLELTEERLDRVIATLEKSRAAGSGRAEKAAKLDQLHADREAIWEKNGDKIEATRNKRGDVEVCYTDGYQKITEQRMEEYRQKALTDPAIREKFTKAAQEYNAAAAAGDSTAIAKLHQVLQGEVLPTREDSAAVRKQCGPLPPKSAAESQVEQLDKQIAAVQEEIRTIDKKVADAQAEANGMTPQQWAMALERIQMYMAANPSTTSGSGAKSNSGAKSGAGSGATGSGSSNASAALKRSFSEQELIALEKRLAKLRALLG
ncbi:MAG TPA: hypothetical protein VFQ05_14025 [Candidatus Eisenbacteria bacterium]|nr:hypothetical protein [Candidatus Eisenbacteria bacterium]